jgi:DNA-binding NarL/FixJ family response regulator
MPVQSQLWQALVQGQSLLQVPETLVISLATVKAHISSILSKLGVSSRAEAISFAIKNKLVAL